MLCSKSWQSRGVSTTPNPKLYVQSIMVRMNSATSRRMQKNPDPEIGPSPLLNHNLETFLDPEILKPLNPKPLNPINPILSPSKTLLRSL